MRAARDVIGGRREAGFTLIEVLVVLTVVAVATAAVPAITAGLPGVRLRAEADRLAAVLENLHQAAQLRGTPTAFVFNPRERTYVTSLDQKPAAFSQVVDAIGIRARPDPGSRAVDSVRFFPDGSATGTDIVLRSGQRQETVTVDWLTGRVRRGS